MPWDRDNYPADWEALAEAAKRRAGYRCERCGVGRYDLHRTRAGHLTRMPLVAAHVHGEDVGDPGARLVCMCTACHGRYDAPQQRRLHAAEERRRLIAAGQLELWPGEDEA